MRKLKDSRRAEIVDAALLVAAEQGVKAVSMRAVAARIGLTPMALYGYFRNKDELLDAIIGRMLAEISRPAADLGWRETILHLAAEVRSVARRHPSVFPLLFTRPAVSPSAIMVIDLLFDALLRAGVEPAQVPRMERMISTFLIGYAISEVGGRFSEGTLDTRGRRAQLEPDLLPGHQLLAGHLDAPVDWDAEYRADLDGLLDIVAGLAARDQRRRQPIGKP
ncbi:TetR/AcrR family transcriptional regulator [Sphaerisporangium sp. NPDC005289]|uniref:TetR/AcrR family transcriptional regulator n=1 Tax=Sphaerisporangium sp. NPDC005289 TaxID=3155247 RepID=UPI0033A832D5